jgi:hypothetical protein
LIRILPKTGGRTHKIRMLIIRPRVFPSPASIPQKRKTGLKKWELNAIISPTYDQSIKE